MRLRLSHSAVGKGQKKTAAKPTRKGKGGRATPSQLITWRAHAFFSKATYHAGAAQEKPAEPIYVPARLVTWPAILSALEGLLRIDLFACIWPHEISFQQRAQTLGRSSASASRSMSSSQKRRWRRCGRLWLDFQDITEARLTTRLWSTLRPRNSAASSKPWTNGWRKSTSGPYFVEPPKIKGHFSRRFKCERAPMSGVGHLPRSHVPAWLGRPGFQERNAEAFTTPINLHIPEFY